MAMDYEFGYYYGNEEMVKQLLPVVSVIAAVFLTVLVITSLVRGVCYVLRSLALYSTAKRRALKHAWLAWVPVGQEWIIGSVSDQYQYLTQGKNQNRRTVLLWLKLGALLVGILSWVVGIFRILVPLVTAGGGYLPEEALMLTLPMVGSMLLGLISFVVGIIAYVFRQVSMYDLYRSCDPKNAVPYLVFGILFGILEPVFLMILRNRDDGMPPRRSVSEEPAGENQ